MIDEQKLFMAAFAELFRMQEENCAFQGDELELATELAALIRKFEETIVRLGVRQFDAIDDLSTVDGYCYGEREIARAIAILEKYAEREDTGLAR